MPRRRNRRQRLIWPVSRPISCSRCGFIVAIGESLFKALATRLTTLDLAASGKDAQCHGATAAIRRGLPAFHETLPSFAASETIVPVDALNNRVMQIQRTRHIEHRRKQQTEQRKRRACENTGGAERTAESRPPELSATASGNYPWMIRKRRNPGWPQAGARCLRGRVPAGSRRSSACLGITIRIALFAARPISTTKADLREDVVVHCPARQQADTDETGKSDDEDDAQRRRGFRMRGEKQERRTPPARVTQSPRCCMPLFL